MGPRTKEPSPANAVSGPQVCHYYYSGRGSANQKRCTASALEPYNRISEYAMLILNGARRGDIINDFVCRRHWRELETSPYGVVVELDNGDRYRVGPLGGRHVSSIAGGPRRIVDGEVRPVRLDAPRIQYGAGRQNRAGGPSGAPARHAQPAI